MLQRNATTSVLSESMAHSRGVRSHKSQAAESAFAEMRVQHTSTCPQMAEWCRAIKWLIKENMSSE